MTTAAAAPQPPSLIPGDQSRGAARWVVAALVGLLVFLFVQQGVRIARLPTAQRVTWNVVIDDGYYYLQVARNIARGHGATFDRIHPTNGFQPLWALMLVPIFWVTDDPGAGMQAMLVLASLLGGLAIALLAIGLARLVGLGSALLVAALCVANPYFLQICQGGLETPALFACLGGLVAFWARCGPAVLRAERRACLGMGALLGLTVLARTDVALALAPLCLALVLLPGGQRLPRLLWIALPGAALVLPYVAWNYLTQGSVVPVSGLVKRWVAATYQPTWDLFKITEQWRGVSRTLHLLVWPWTMPGREQISRIPAQLLLAGVPLALLALRLLWSRRARQNRLALVLLGCAALGVAGHGLYIFFGYRSAGHWNYHYFFPFSLLTTALLVTAPALLLADLGLLLDRLVARRRLALGFAALAAALCLAPAAYLVREGLASAQKRFAELQRDPNQSFRKSRYDGALYMARHYPKDTVFGAWWAGTVGYFSDQRVVNLDGVINSAAYFHSYLKRDRVPQFIVEGSITHLCDFFWRDPLHPPTRPAWRNFFWEHDKEHVVARLRDRLTLDKVFRFRASGFYIMKVRKGE